MANPLLEEIYETRAKIAKKHGYDIGKLCKALREKADARESNVAAKSKVLQAVGSKVKAGLKKRVGRRAARRRVT